MMQNEIYIPQTSYIHFTLYSQKGWEYGYLWIPVPKKSDTQTQKSSKCLFKTRPDIFPGTPRPAPGIHTRRIGYPNT